MRTSLRRTLFALAIAAAFLAVASPAAATPPEEPARAASLTSSELVTDLLAWFGQWFEGEAPTALWQAGGHAIDPNGEPEESDTSDGPQWGDGGGATTQGGHAIDPDG